MFSTLPIFPLPWSTSAPFSLVISSNTTDILGFTFSSSFFFFFLVKSFPILPPDVARLGDAQTSYHVLINSRQTFVNWRKDIHGHPVA
ncbi:hypothetical protein Tsubulata_051058 [Turnera subulata]|uniref:Uncharacterized protein n=1 Tax=Turnera subulata TaxID=218843 RepID=A0A9Q0GGK5_9ROSI|nr:hypothetical protein Tsubulata_051058 [Turnera subulata]